MAAPNLSNQQSARLSAYRRRRAPPDSLSDSQLPKDDRQVPGEPRSVDQHAPQPQTGGAFGSAMRRSGQATPPSSDNRARRWRTSPPGLVADTSNNSQSGPPQDITGYILQLEQQNSDLRSQVVELQAALSGAKVPNSGSEESKRAFLNDVLQQVEAVIDAHRSKSNSEIAKYKTEAEQAQLALKTLRQSIQQSGLDLAMAPALIAFHRKQAAAASLGTMPQPEPLGLTLPAETHRLLDQLASDLLNKLLTIRDQDELSDTVRQSVKSSFEAIIVHFTDELFANVKLLDQQVESLKRELMESRDENRKAQLNHEAARVRLATEHAIEIEAIRDEVRAFHNASLAAPAGGDDVAAGIHEKAFTEYAQLLTEARRDAAHWKQEVENEKNHSAHVIVQLKAELQQRTQEFERVVAQRAEDVVQQRDRWITELERKLREREGVTVAKEFRDANIQAGEPLVTMPTADSFVPSLLGVARKDARSTAQSSEMFEREVWRKTQELLAKYGR